MKSKWFVYSALALSSQSMAFDLEDYATTYRATKDAYLKAQLDFVLSKNALDQFKNLLTANCLQVSDASGVTFANSDGLMTGTCNRDNQKADPAGGVLADAGKKKLGSVMSRIVDLMPASVAANYGDVAILKDLSSLDSRLRAIRDSEYQIKEVAMQAATVTISSKSGCTKTNNSIQSAITSGMTIADLENKFKLLRDTHMKDLTSLKIATAPFIAAKNAYRSASAVYLKGIGCSSNHKSYSWRYDPFNPDPDGGSGGLKTR